MDRDLDKKTTQFCINIDTSTLFVSTVTHQFRVDLDSQLELIRDHEYEICLARYDIYNSVKNISASQQNNKVLIDFNTGVFQELTIPDGIYSLTDINKVVKELITAAEQDSSNFSIYGDYNLLRVILKLPVGWRYDFSGNSLYKILGFEQQIYLYNLGQNIAPNNADVSNGINALSVSCSLVDSRYNFSNSEKNDSLYILPIDVASGSLLSGIIQNNIWKTMSHGDHLRNVDIRIRSLDCKTVVDLGGEHVSLTLHIRER